MTMQALRESKYDQNGAAITGTDGVKQVGLHKLHVTLMLLVISRIFIKSSFPKCFITDTKSVIKLLP